MNTYLSVLLCLAGAELLRRCYSVVICAFTGPLSKIPGPFLNKFTPIPWGIQNLTGNSMNVAPKMFAKYGDVIRVGPRDVMIAEKSGVQKILVDEDFVKAPVYEKRRLISPGFSISYLNGLEPLMKECLDVLERTLNKECEKGGGHAVINMSQMLGNLTSDVMSATSFGGSFGLVESNDLKMKNMVMDRLKRAALDAQLPFIKYLPFVPPSQGEGLNNIIDDIVATRKAESQKPKKDLLQIIVDVNENNPDTFTHLHVREEMSLFMIAGADTTSTTATFTLLLLVNNQDKLKKLVEEIDFAFPSIHDSITFAKTQDLPYLNAVINESMRRMPIVALGLARWTEKTSMISGFEIPKDTIVSPAVGQLMRDPRVWPDPDKFIPERWLEPYKDVEADKKAFHPFSSGSRNCPGQQFALKELRLILVTLIRRYELSLVPGQSHEMRLHTVPWFTQGFYNVGVKQR
ncbi:cytochrome P450 [Mollisia scopiformis]|uniref:Cytochrome P450 n=1 Tax=Mollisia scopiformis TaxID=149040 RepID=A0A132B2J1_MOLSC|nr:cytochrome P450 [Mollisia scopiformis]KUJ06610.1 cytochrome P450 [Mollisia scopiformis]